MKQESPKDKLLEACGVGVSSKAGPEQERESKKYSEARLAQAQTAPARVPQAQDQTDQVYRRLSAYLRDELPAHCGFRAMSATYSDACRPPIPIEVSHPFRFKPATYSV